MVRNQETGRKGVEKDNEKETNQKTDGGRGSGPAGGGPAVRGFALSSAHYGGLAGLLASRLVLDSYA